MRTGVHRNLTAENYTWKTQVFNTPYDNVSYMLGGDIVPDFTIGDPFLDEVQNNSAVMSSELVGLAFKIAGEVSDFQQQDFGKNSMLVIVMDTVPD